MAECPVMRQPFESTGRLSPRQLPCSHTISEAGLDRVRLQGLQPLQHVDV